MARRNLQRQQPTNEEPFEQHHEALYPHDDGELQQLKRLYGPVFKRAFAAALQQLDKRQRNILRLFHLEQLTTEEIGRIYGVHRVSVSRWLSEARQLLKQTTLGALGEDLRASRNTVASIVKLLDSQLAQHLSLHLSDE